ncbi:MAG: undecaprenyl-diphosphate phosphatase [Deltaproteobacteria bacterium]|nr:undecaprenyl-diphosphate phosphatase [Deltaproteobacteria bacterium]
MSLWEGILLGIIQGLTELLPVSSSGHLVIAQSLLPNFHQPGVLFDVMLHLGTLSAVIFFLRRDILDILKALLPPWRRQQPLSLFEHMDESMIPGRRRLAAHILTATVITGMIGLSFQDQVHALFQSVEITAVGLLVTGVLLFFADRIRDANRTGEEMTFADSMVIGLVQGIAIMPGISRSGSTIAFGIFRGLSGETAARFSFLISIPAILGAAILEGRHLTGVNGSEIPAYVAGMAAAAVVGFLTLKFLFLMIRKRDLRFFGYYCWVLGALTLAVRTLF